MMAKIPIVVAISMNHVDLRDL